MNKLRVGVLGATGAVGQRMIAMLANHPWFYVGEVCASERSAGQTYGDAVTWRMDSPLPVEVAKLVVKPCVPPLPVDLVFSALPKSQALDVEKRFAEFGTPVISNASAYRMDPLVPLIVPELNAHHLALVDRQRTERGWKGFIVTNPNCATIGLVFPLAVAQRSFGLTEAHVTTFQARSGAGFPGPSPEVIGDNVLPFIGGEEDKLETEPQKILGAPDHPATFAVSAQCNRVDVSDGHLECVSLTLASRATPEAFCAELRRFNPSSVVAHLPSAPSPTIVVLDDPDRPQPKLDRNLGNGMAVSVGRVRRCPINDLKMVVLSHNTVRGAAGAALLNAELLVQEGYLKRD